MDDEITRLLSWDANDTIPIGSYVRLESHPAYVPAVRTLASRMLAAAAEDKALDGIAKDAGRYTATIWSLYLHATGGLTLPRLKEICAASGLLSPGRARAVLLFLRYLGFITPLPQEDRREPVRYAPTPALIKTWRRIVAEDFEAVRLVEPAIHVVARRLEEKIVLETYMRHIGEGLLVAARAGVGETVFTRVFIHRHAGMQLLYWIILSADSDDEFPPAKPVSLSIAAIARQLRVSRVHIKRILNEAAREGFLTFDDAGRIVLAEKARWLIRYAVSTAMIGFIICAAKTARVLSDTTFALREHASTGAEQ